MALADILRRIDRDAESESSTVVITAEEDAARKRDEVEKRASGDGEDLLAREEAKAHEDARTRIAAARLRGRDSVLTEKRTLIERVLIRAVSQLEELPDADYAALVAREVKSSTRGGERLFLGARDADRLRAHLPAALADVDADVEIEDFAADFERGVMLESGRTRVRISAESIVAARREDLEALVTTVLLDGDAED